MFFFGIFKKLHFLSYKAIKYSVLYVLTSLIDVAYEKLFNLVDFHLNFENLSLNQNNNLLFIAQISPGLLTI